ncbi:MAG TPA: hypothetical protein VMH01_17070 [Puia sp.]|nr:hypothetical protein [Puia sp.]
MRKQIKKFQVALLCILVLSLSFSMMSYKNRNTSAFSAKETFEGIFFGKGSVADRLPEIKDYINSRRLALTDKQKSDLASIEDFVTSEIQKEYPQALEEFQNQINSHDFLSVEKALISMSEKVTRISFDYFLQHNLISREHYAQLIKDEKLADASGKDVLVTTTTTTSTSTDTAVEVQLISSKVAAAGDSKSKLQTEMFVNSIVTNL